MSQSLPKRPCRQSSGASDLIRCGEVREKKSKICSKILIWETSDGYEPRGGWAYRIKSKIGDGGKQINNNNKFHFNVWFLKDFRPSK